MGFDSRDLDIRPIPLAESEDSYNSNDCIVMGWSQQETELMKHVKLPLVENDKCQELLRATDIFKSRWRLDGSFICAGGEEGTDVCQGDGGGPLVCKHNTKEEYVLAGIISWGINCGKKDIPGVYASVVKALPFIG